MIIDILICILILLISIYGYRKGFIIQLINLVVGIVYLYFVSSFLDVGLKQLNNKELSDQLLNNAVVKYLVIIIVGIVIMFLLNILLRKIFKKGVLSFFNKIGGLIISISIIYLLLCITNIVFTTIGQFLVFDEAIRSSFFLSDSFKEYNFIARWLSE